MGSDSKANWQENMTNNKYDMKMWYAEPISKYNHNPVQVIGYNCTMHINCYRRSKFNGIVPSVGY